MQRPDQAHRRHVLIAGLGHGDVHRVFGDHVAEGPVPGDQSGRRSLGEDLGPGGRHEQAFADLPHVPGQMEDPVGVDTAQVRRHQGVGDTARVAVVGAGGEQDAPRQAVQFFGGNGRHWSLLSLALIPG